LKNIFSKNFEQSGKRRNLKAKPRLNSRSNKGTSRNARNRKAAVRKRMKAARYIYLLPELSSFALPRGSDRKEAVNDYTVRKNKLK
jgi:hypothetical protein